jgi:hypothetical protein
VNKPINWHLEWLRGDGDLRDAINRMYQDAAILRKGEKISRIHRCKSSAELDTPKSARSFLYSGGIPLLWGSLYSSRDCTISEG